MAKELNLKERYKIYEKARSKWSFESQMIVACEEFAELIVEVTKHLNGKRGGDYSGLLDELADARIMIEQIESNYAMGTQVKDRMMVKLERLQGLFKHNGHPVKPKG